MKILRTLLFIQLALSVTGAAAARLPDFYPDDFPYAGTLDAIDLRNMTIIVSDRLQQVTDYVQVHDRSGKTAGMRNLRKGMEIGFTTRSAERGGAIVEIWVLPDGYLASQSGKKRY
ncbi:MAG: hypothetical protein R3308_03645 [Thiohalobacterales bacterium]|nr:hypothetical protein [Thiohalobacterales bacterium]